MAVLWRNFQEKQPYYGIVELLQKRLYFSNNAPEQAFNYLHQYVYSQYVPQLGLLNDRVKSGNQADAMVADDHSSH